MQQETVKTAGVNEGLARDVTKFAKTALSSGLMGRNGQKAGAAIGVATGNPSKKTGGVVGSAAASGLLGHKGRQAAHALGLGRPEGQGGMSVRSVLGSGLAGPKGIVAGAAIDLVKGIRKH